HPPCWVPYSPGKRPGLVYYQPGHHWPGPPAAPGSIRVEEFRLPNLRAPGQAAPPLPGAGRRAIVGETDAALPGFEPNNPKALLDYLHYHRAYKTPYELDRMRAAQRRAVPGHLAAREAFQAGAAEAQIHAAYLAATGHTDLDLP